MAFILLNLMNIKKEFYIFSPPWKKIKIYYSPKEILDNKILKVMALKTLPHWYFKFRTNKIFASILNLFLKIKKEIPKKDTFLIYEGYDSSIFFYKKNGELSVIRKIENSYIEEPFLGYPIHWDFSLKEIPNKNKIQSTLKKHWELLKTGKARVHGDFTHANILLDEEGEVTVIDSRQIKQELPIINDLFYFYSYFLYRASLYNNDKFYEKILEEIYAQILIKDKNILRLVDKLDRSAFHFTKKRKTFCCYKKRFKDFLIRIL